MNFYIKYFVLIFPLIHSIFGSFVHPGLLHTEKDFARIKSKLAVNATPWDIGWKKFSSNFYVTSGLGRHPRPQEAIRRGGGKGENYHLLYQDISVAYHAALYWRITGNTAYADKAVEYMNAWSSKLKIIGGDSNFALAGGLYGYQFANVGELMRGYKGLSAANFTAFQNMMHTVFYSANNDFLTRHNGAKQLNYWTNWDFCNIASVIAIGVLTDNKTIFDQGVNFFKGGQGTGAISLAVYYMHPGYMGQWQESGRDQGHATLGIALGGAICEMAWNQGVDLYGLYNNRFLAGAEYVAKSNLILGNNTIPYVPYIDAVNRRWQLTFSDNARGIIRPGWALVYNHYVNRKGLAAPWSGRSMMKLQNEGGEGGGGDYGGNSGGYDQLGYGTLMHSRDPIPKGAAPSGLTAVVSAGTVTLSWWGGAYAKSYTVKRSTSLKGKYEQIKTTVDNTVTDEPGVGTFFYKVAANNTAGPESNIVTAVNEVKLLAHLGFNETKGSVAVDASGNKNTGTLQNGANFVSGKMGNAVSLDGTNDSVSLPANLFSDVADFSITGWVFMRSATPHASIFSFSNDPIHFMILTPRVKVDKWNYAARFAISNNGAGGERKIDIQAKYFPTNEWVHFAITLSGTKGTVYINGDKVGENPNIEFAPFRIGNTSQNWIGGSKFGPYFNGMIDEFRIYRGALSTEQIKKLSLGQDVDLPSQHERMISKSDRSAHQKLDLLTKKSGSFANKLALRTSSRIHQSKLTSKHDRMGTKSDRSAYQRLGSITKKSGSFAKKLTSRTSSRFHKSFKQIHKSSRSNERVKAQRSKPNYQIHNKKISDSERSSTDEEEGDDSEASNDDANRDEVDNENNHNDANDVQNDIDDEENSGQNDKDDNISNQLDNEHQENNFSRKKKISPKYKISQNAPKMNNNGHLRHTSHSVRSSNSHKRSKKSKRKDSNKRKKMIEKKRHQLTTSRRAHSRRKASSNKRGHKSKHRKSSRKKKKAHTNPFISEYKQATIVDVYIPRIPYFHPGYLYDDLAKNAKAYNV